MTNYFYPKVVSTGYRTNIHYRTKYELGIECMGVGDSGEETYVTFSRELTETEKTKLDALMAGDPFNPPTNVSTVAEIKDIFEIFDELKGVVNMPNLQLYYVESVPGSGVIDRIRIVNTTSPTTNQKNSFQTQYNNLLTKG